MKYLKITSKIILKIVFMTIITLGYDDLSYAESSFFIDTKLGKVISSSLEIDKPSLSLTVGNNLGETFNLNLIITKTLGHNDDSQDIFTGVEPVLSQNAIYSETVNSMAIFSLEPEYRRNFRKNYNLRLSAGPALFQIDTKQSVRFAPGSTSRGNIGGGEQIPSSTNVTQFGYGGISHFSIYCDFHKSLSLALSGSFFFGRYEREVNFDELSNPALANEFSSVKTSKTFSGIGIGFGLEQRF